MYSIEDKDFVFFKKSINPEKESILKFKKFINLLDLYQKKMNLIGSSTRINIWRRHILDSAQIEKYLHKENKNNPILDVGTGAGFPGIVLAILGRSDILLCEKSKKKINFLNVIIKECDLKVKVLNSRVEDIKAHGLKTIICRAFAPLKILIFKVKHLICKDTILILHKGKSYMKEITEAEHFFSFNYKCYDSLTNTNSKIVAIENIKEKYGKN